VHYCHHGHGKRPEVCRECQPENFCFDSSHHNNTKGVRRPTCRGCAAANVQARGLARVGEQQNRRSAGRWETRGLFTQKEKHQVCTRLGHQGSRSQFGTALFQHLCRQCIEERKSATVNPMIGKLDNILHFAGYEVSLVAGREGSGEDRSCSGVSFITAGQASAMGELPPLTEGNAVPEGGEYELDCDDSVWVQSGEGAGTFDTSFGGSTLRRVPHPGSALSQPAGSETATQQAGAAELTLSSLEESVSVSDSLEEALDLSENDSGLSEWPCLDKGDDDEGWAGLEFLKSDMEW
jgi:hypothetical protein